jgi:hypothetical protein
LLDRILVSLVGAFFVFSLRIGWDALGVMRQAGLPIWPIVREGLPISIGLGIAFPFILKEILAKRKSAS